MLAWSESPDRALFKSRTSDFQYPGMSAHAFLWVLVLQCQFHNSIFVPSSFLSGTSAEHWERASLSSVFVKCWFAVSIEELRRCIKSTHLPVSPSTLSLLGVSRWPGYRRWDLASLDSNSHRVIWLPRGEGPRMQQGWTCSPRRFLCCFWNSKGILYYEQFPQGHTVTAVDFVTYLHNSMEAGSEEAAGMIFSAPSLC